jgi:hypothetical protein
MVMAKDSVEVSLARKERNSLGDLADISGQLALEVVGIRHELKRIADALAPVHTPPSIADTKRLVESDQREGEHPVKWRGHLAEESIELTPTEVKQVEKALKIYWGDEPERGE